MARSQRLASATLPPTRERGVALITSLVIVAIVASTAALFSLGQQVWLRQVQNLADRTQAQSVASGALEWAAIILTEDAKDNNVDDLTEVWAQNLPPLPAEGGLVTGTIVDAQGRFNLNNVVRQGKPSNEDIAVLRRLLQAQELPGLLADALVDWLDADSSSQPGGAEDVDYLSSEPPYRAANGRLQSIGELRLIRGFTAETVTRLAPLVTALPEETTINVNTALPAVLGAMFSDLSSTELEDLIASRKDKPFKDAADFKQRLPASAAPPKLPYDVKSAYFDVTVDTLFGRAPRRVRALLHRPPGASVRVLWQQQQLVITAAAEASG